jgi:hypothetical protein
MQSPSTSALSFFKHTTLICYSCSQVSEFWCTFKESVVQLSCSLLILYKHTHTSFPSALISRWTCFPVTNKVPLFWTVFIYTFTQLTLRVLMSYIYGVHILDVSRSHTTTHQSVGLLWTSDQLIAETSTWQHMTLTTDKYPCLRWESNPRSQ